MAEEMFLGAYDLMEWLFEKYSPAYRADMALLYDPEEVMG